MSQPASSRKNEPAQALLSLAQWGEDRAAESDMGNSPVAASAGHRQSLILAGLAGKERAGGRAPEITTPMRSGPSVADLLRGRSKAPETDIPAAAGSTSRDDAQPKSMRLLRAAARARTEAGRAPAEAVAAQPVAEPARPRRGVAGTIAGLLKGRQRQPEAAREEVSSPPAPSREPRRMAVRRQAPAAFAPPLLPERVQGAAPAEQPGPRSPVHGHRPVDPYAAYAPPPVAVQQHPYPPAPPSMPGYHPAMPMPVQAPMPQPASAHFYWPQPAMQMPWVPVQQAYWPVMPPPAVQVPPEQPAPAPATPASAVQQAGPDPLTAEIDGVREQLRVFGDALRQLHHTRASRRIG